MPTILTGVQGQTSQTQQERIAIETAVNGESVLLAQSAGASTMSLTTQPNTISATTGMHLHGLVIGNTTAGTIAISGTNPAGGSFTSITYHIPVAPQNSQGYSEFTTKEVFATVNASGIVLSSLTPCQIVIFGSFGGKYLIPLNLDKEEKITKFSPPDKRGILFKNLRVVQLTKGVDVSKFDAALYPDSLWAYYMAIGNTPTIATLPATPDVLLASTAIASPMTLTTGPTTPGEFLVFSLTTNTASGTIVVGGTDQFGNVYSTSETIAFTSAATQTVYSSRRYSVVNTGGSNKFTTTGGTGANIAVSGVYAWSYAFVWDGINHLTPYSACVEVFDGAMGVVLPGFILDSLNLAWAKEKEIALTSKGMAQDFLIVGDPSNTSSIGTNPFATIGQPISNPMVSWPSNFYIESATATPFTAADQDGSMLDFKFGITTGRKWMYAGDGQQRPSYVTWDSEPDFTVDATIIFQNYLNYVNYFKPNTPLILATTFTGSWLGTISGTPLYESVQIILPTKVDTFKVDQTKSPVSGVLKVMSNYDFSNLGYGYKVVVTAQVPPTYLS